MGKWARLPIESEIYDYAFKRRDKENREPERPAHDEPCERQDEEGYQIGEDHIKVENYNCNQLESCKHDFAPVYEKSLG